MVRRALRLAFLAAALGAAASGQAAAQSLSQIGKIDLGPVAGSINGLALDYAHQRMFVLEGGAGRLAVIDLATGTVSQTLTGLSEAKGLARAPTDDRLYVATSEGKLALFAGVPLQPAAGISLGPDLGPPLYDAGSERIYLDYGAKKIAIIDTTHNKHWDDIRLNGRPGAMAMEDGGSLIYVAEAGAKRVMVADRDGNKQVTTWSSGDNADAAALALDEEAGRLIAAYRQPASIVWFDIADGTIKGHTDGCAKAGQLIADNGRNVIYLTCGEGRIDIYRRDGNGNYAKGGSVATAPDATAALLVPTSGRLYLAVPSLNGAPAEVRIYAPPS